jgi:hypothetical protein
MPRNIYIKQVEKDSHVLKTCLKYVGNGLNALKMPKTCQKRFTCFEMC